MPTEEELQQQQQSQFTPEEPENSYTYNNPENDTAFSAYGPTANIYPDESSWQQNAQNNRNNILNTYNSPDIASLTGGIPWGPGSYAHDRWKINKWDPKTIMQQHIQKNKYPTGKPDVFVDGDQRELFYSTMGTAAINAVISIAPKVNKYKGLYAIVQYRMENSFNMNPPLNNPFNIKSKGDLGYALLTTTEYKKNSNVSYTTKQNFGNFSTIEKGFIGYFDLLKSNFNIAYETLKSDTKTIEDFANGLLNGSQGIYATNPHYASSMKDMLKSIVNDYKKIYTGQMSIIYSKIAKDQEYLYNTGSGPQSAIFNEIKRREIEYNNEIKRINQEIIKLAEFEINEKL